jgi:WD40 repeat protein
LHGKCKNNLQPPLTASTQNFTVQKLHHFTGHQGAVYALEASPEKDFFFSGSGDSYVTRWNADGKVNPEAVIRAQATVYSLCLMREKNLLAIGESSGTLHVVDLNSKKEIHNIVFHTAGIYDIKFSQRYQRLFTAAGDGSMGVWDEEGFKLLFSKKLCEQKVRAVAVSDKHSLAAFACGDGTIAVYNADSLAEVIRFSAHELSANSIAFHPGGKHLLTGGRDAFLRIWNIENNFELEKEIPAHNYAIYKIMFNTSGTLFATASRDKTAKVWDAADAAFLFRLDKENFSGHLNSVNSVLWLNDDTLISASDDRSIIIWKIAKT